MGGYRAAAGQHQTVTAAGLDEATWAAAWDAGRAMAPEQAVAEALEEPADG